MSQPDPTPTPAAEHPARLRFYGLCALLWLFFALIAYLTPIVLDDWFEAVWIKQHGLSPASVWEYASYNYLNYNPRLGETFLLLINGPRLIHVLVTPTVELLLLFVVFELAHGRWPRPTRDDVYRLLLAQALIFMIVPAVAVIYFYRPYTSNYLFGICFQLSLFVPYRRELAAPRPGRWWWIPLLALWGFAAGMTNEHTGPTAMLALVALVVLLARGGRKLRAWMMAGLVGLWTGYFALFFAPGQSKRYGGAAAKASPLATILDRGLGGAQEILHSYFWEAQLALVLVMIAVALALLSARRRGQPLLAPGRVAIGVTLVAFAAAGAILATMLASPMVAERLYLAPCLLLVIGLLPLVDALLAEPMARRFLVGAAVVGLGFQMVRLTVEFSWANDAFTRRMAILEAAPAGSVAHVKPYRRWQTTPLYFGDDFLTFTHRQYVAHEYFGLAGIELDHAGRWAEPRPPFDVEYQLHFDPPLDEAGWRRYADMPTYTPSYAEWLVAKLRRFLPRLTTIPGHRLERVEVVVHGVDLPELAGRRLIWLTWQDGKFTFPEGGVLVDSGMMPYFILKRPNIPPDLNEAYVYACGRSVPVPIQPHEKGIAMPWIPWCRGSQLAIACSPELCWLAAATWR